MKKQIKAKKYLLVHELELLSSEMRFAMLQAYPEYVAERRMTPNMERVLERYYDWARRANAAGL